MLHQYNYCTWLPHGSMLIINGLEKHHFYRVVGLLSSSSAPCCAEAGIAHHSGNPAQNIKATPANQGKILLILLLCFQQQLFPHSALTHSDLQLKDFVNQTLLLHIQDIYSRSLLMFLSSTNSPMCFRNSGKLVASTLDNISAPSIILCPLIICS